MKLVRFVRGRPVSRRVAAVLLAAVAMVVAAGIGATDAPEHPLGQPSRAAAAPTTTTTNPAARPKAQRVKLPTPVRPPDDPYAYEPEILLGTIEIPRIGLSHPLYEGVSLMSIDRGPSHWPGTAMPGKLGNAVIAGHRVTRTHPFREIDQLQPGDQVIFTVRGKRSVYSVTGSEVVTPDAMHVVDQHAKYTATLFACHPPGSARFRYIVHLTLVGPRPTQPR